MDNHHRNYGHVADSNTTVEAAWQLCLKHPEIRKDFEGQAKTYGWDVAFGPDVPFWAYWFARNVIKDEWLPGEDIIIVDKKVWKTYCQYTENLREFDCLGCSLRDDPHFVVDHYGVIRGWKPGYGPIMGPGKMAKRETLVERFGTSDAATIADRIARQMEEFKANKKLRDVSQEDETDEN